MGNLVITNGFSFFWFVRHGWVDSYFFSTYPSAIFFFCKVSKIGSCYDQPIWKVSRYPARRSTPSSCMVLYTPWTLKCGNSGFQPQNPGTFESFSSQDWLVRGQLSAVGFWSCGWKVDLWLMKHPHVFSKWLASFLFPARSSHSIVVSNLSLPVCQWPCNRYRLIGGSICLRPIFQA